MRFLGFINLPEIKAVPWKLEAVSEPWQLRSEVSLHSAPAHCFEIEG